MPCATVAATELPPYVDWHTMPASLWGSFCGDAAACLKVRRAFPQAVVVVAEESHHSVKELAR